MSGMSDKCTFCDYYPVTSCPKYKTEWPNCCPNLEDRHKKEKMKVSKKTETFL